MSVTIEARLKSDYQGPISKVGPILRDWVAANCHCLSKGQNIDSAGIIGDISDQIDRLHVSDTSSTDGAKEVHIPTAKILVHPYKYFQSLPRTIRIPMEGETGETGPTVLMHELPSKGLADSWDQLFFQPDIKPMLLKFVTSLYEVESICSSRKAAASANEPADAIRVVNSLLTSLDRLKSSRNVLVLATSNLLEVIDVAFLDRVDLCQHVTSPSVVAAYSILLSCMQELIRCGIITVENEMASVYDYNIACLFRAVRPELPSSKLLDIAEKSQGMSGRALRRVPLLMHATVIDNESISLSEALDAMCLVVENERASVRLLVKDVAK
ncbi:hypothetical protein AA313_de0200493 [Arthrobotrys entomopaga]|nr:hypothetical protein AA313_de0200493 [Arthrobotrys entomopaga]